MNTLGIMWRLWGSWDVSASVYDKCAERQIILETTAKNNPTKHQDYWAAHQSQMVTVNQNLLPQTKTRLSASTNLQTPQDLPFYK